MLQNSDHTPVHLRKLFQKEGKLNNPGMRKIVFKGVLIHVDNEAEKDICKAVEECKASVGIEVHRACR